MTKWEKVLNGLEVLANKDGFPLEVRIERPQSTWNITFIAGNAAIQTTMENFINYPKTVLEPFVEELIRRNT